MWVLISGRVLSVFVILVIGKLFENFSDLILFEKIIGWFLVDHILEEYHLTSGKFFLINEDYRFLIRNITVLILSICFFAQILTPLEFCLVNIFLIAMFLVLTQKKLKDKIRFFIFFCYIYLIHSFLIINFYFLFELLKFLVLTSIFIFSLGFYLYCFCLVIVYKSSLKKLKQIILFCNTKVMLYLGLFSLEISFVVYLLSESCISLNNFVSELVFMLLSVYTYMFYFIFKV
jgi:hypothetical protein